MTTLKKDALSLLILLLLTLVNSGCEDKATPVDDTLDQPQQEQFQKGKIDTHGRE